MLKPEPETRYITDPTHVEVKAAFAKSQVRSGDTHTHTHTHTHAFSLSLSLSHTHTHSLSLSLSLKYFADEGVVRSGGIEREIFIDNLLVRVHLLVDPPCATGFRIPTFLTALLDPRDPLLRSERTQGFTAGPVYGRARCSPMVGSLKTSDIDQK